MEETKRPWGEYQVIRKDKILKIKPNSSLSLQYHKNRTEFWTVLEGYGTAQLDFQDIALGPGVTLKIEPLQVHRIITGDKPLVILEKAVGSVDEDDIMRVEDEYDRV